jgi:plasmid maintenance system antidote protein VapI
MTNRLWVRHLNAEDILELQSLMVLLAGRDMEEREAAFKGMLEILNPVADGVRSMLTVKPSFFISAALEERNWTVEKFADYLIFYASWHGSSMERSKKVLCDLLAGTKRIDEHAASMLSLGFGKSATYWLDIQAAYDKATGAKQ